MFFKRNKNYKTIDSKKQSKPNSNDYLTKIPIHIQEAEFLIKDKLNHSPNIIVRDLSRDNCKMAIFYFEHLTDTNVINHDIIEQINKVNSEFSDSDKVKEILSVGQIKCVSDLNSLVNFLLRGWVYLHIHGQSEGVLINAFKPAKRSIGNAELETVLSGPQFAFTESLSTNVALIRNLISHSSLCSEALEVGVRTRTNINILYIHELSNEQNLNTLRQRISEIEIDGLIGSSILAQLIEDHSFSIFPQMILTERPDSVSLSLLEGKIAILVEGSSLAILCPCAFLDFFKSPEDYYVRWNLSSFIRFLRYVAVIISVFLTPSYVIALTFHYEVIPTPLLITLGESRSKVPFPPLFETLLLELLIEFLREAGARLPTKVGQTMGIVGGIVIGEAAVQAGFTSNILIMLIAFAALSSFTVPNYFMGISIRLLRFPLIIMAGIWGSIGIMFGICFVILHLLRMSSLNNPYLFPIYPVRIAEFKDSFIRFPYSFLTHRTNYTRGSDKRRSNPIKTSQDIDE